MKLSNKMTKQLVAILELGNQQIVDGKKFKSSKPALDKLNWLQRLVGLKPLVKRPARQFLIDENGFLDIQSYLEMFQRFGNSGRNTFNRCGLQNYILLASIVTNKGNPKHSFRGSLLFHLHWIGHIDVTQIIANSSRRLSAYTIAGYPIKASAISDFLLWITSKSYKSKENKDFVIQLLRNRLDFLLNRSEYNVRCFKKRIKRLNFLISQKMDSKFFVAKKSKAARSKQINNLLDFHSLMLQEGVLLCVTLSYIFEILEMPEELKLLKIYAKELNTFLSVHKICLIKGVGDDFKYRVKYLWEKNFVQQELKDFNIPINFAVFASYLAKNCLPGDDPMHYNKLILLEMCQKSSELANSQISSSGKLFFGILVKIFELKVSEDEGTNILAELIHQRFLELAS